VSSAHDDDAQRLHAGPHGGGSATPSSAMPCASAAATRASRSSTSVAPAWKASALAFASTSAEGLRADRRQVEAGILARLRDLDDARPGCDPAGAQDRRVRALDRLDGEHRAPAHDQSLADPEGRDRLRERPPEGDVRELLAARGDAPMGARPGDQLRHQLGLRQQADAVFRQVIGDTGKDRRVVATAAG
jgi:hypothetical protein